MSIIGKLSENPNIQDIEINKQKIKSEIHKKTEKKIKIEEFEKMSWKDLEKNIRVSEKGTLTIFSKPIKYWLLEAIWTDEQIEGYKNFKEKYLETQKQLIEKYDQQVEQFSLMQEILQIWETEAIQVAQSVWFKGIRDDDDSIMASVEEINRIIQIGVPINEEILQQNFEDIFLLMLDGEKEENIIGEDDIKKVKEIFFDKKLSQEEKEIKIFNLMRYGGLSGNSETIKNIVANKLLEKKEFKKEKEILENPKLKEYLEDDFELIKNVSGSRLIHFQYKLEKILPKEQAKQILEIYQKTKEKLEIGLKYKLGEFNEKRKKEGKTKEEKRPLSLEEFKKLNNFTEKSIDITLNVFKHILISEKLDKKINRGDENKSFEGIYANMIGLAETRGIGDYFTFADENIDNLIDFGVTLAIGAITMGAGAAVTKVAQLGFRGLKSLSYANRGSKLARGMYKTSKLFKKGSFIKYSSILPNGEKIKKTTSLQSILGNATLDGIAFHEGAVAMQNILFGDFENWKHQALDSNEIVKSIAFMGGLNSLRYVSSLPGMEKIMTFEQKIPKQYLDAKVIGKILKYSISGVRDGSIMFGISQTIEQLLGNGWNPTVKEYIHFIALIQVMHLKDVKIKK